MEWNFIKGMCQTYPLRIHLGHRILFHSVVGVSPCECRAEKYEETLVISVIRGIP